MITPAYAPTATERVLPRLALDFTTGVLDARVTIARALNTATRVNSSGLIEGVNADLPRFDYDPSTLAAKGLLIEESRTNQFSYSEDFSNGTGWPFGTGTTVSANAIEAPDGNTTADKIAEDSSTGVHQRSRSFTFVSGTSYSYSVFVKAAERTRIQIGAGNPATWAAQAIFDVSSGTVVSTGAGTASITSFGNGWYRCTVSGAALASASTSVLNLLVLSGTTTSYTGVTGSGLYLWGAQLETGAFATSYIPTTAASLTRNADVVSMTGTNFSDWYNASEGTFAIRGLGYSNAANQVFATVSDGTTSNRMLFWFGGTPTTAMRFTMITGGSSVMDGNLGASGLDRQIVVAYKENSTYAAANTSGQNLDTACLIPTVDRLNITGGVGSFSGWLNSIRYWPQRVINNEAFSFSRVV